MHRERVSLFEGLFQGPLEELDELRLCAFRCSGCGETTFGPSSRCLNCGGQNLAETALSKEGVLYTYTVIRNCPPGDYFGKEKFTAYGVGLVELKEGVRLLAPLNADIDRLKIGMPLVLEALVLGLDDAGREVVGFAFRAGD